VLGGILLRNDQHGEVAGILRDEDFYLPPHRAVFAAMTKLHDRGQPIDVVTLEDVLHNSGELGMVGGLEGPAKLADRYTSAHNIRAHAELVKRTSILRNLIRVASEVADEGYGEVPDVAAFIDLAEQRLLEVNQTVRRTDYKPAAAMVRGVFERMVARSKLKLSVTGVPSGFTKLDQWTGGLHGGDLVILAARPSMGKTALALNIAQHAILPPPGARSPTPVLFFSLEMGAEQLIERMLCAEARIDAGRVRSGELQESDFQQMMHAGTRLRNSPLYIDDSASPTILDIRSRARKFSQDRNIFPRTAEEAAQPADSSAIKPPPGMIVVDYLQLCRGGKGRYDSREQEISEVSRGLKAIAKELNMPVMALSQLNRGVDSRADHRPQLSDLRESGAIEQDADIILFIYREERYVTDEAERRKVEGKAEVIVGKHRNGPVGTVHLTFIGKHTRFENPALDGDWN